MSVQITPGATVNGGLKCQSIGNCNIETPGGVCIFQGQLGFNIKDGLAWLGKWSVNCEWLWEPKLNSLAGVFHLWEPSSNIWTFKTRFTF